MRQDKTSHFISTSPPNYGKPLMAQQKIVIIGGGVIGLSTAYHLARRGCREVVLLEKDTLGEGSSSRAAGITSGLLWTETGVNARKVSLARFRELTRELPGYQYHDTHGCLNLYNPALWPEREKLLPLYDRLGVSYEVLNASAIKRRWPEINPEADAIGLLDPRGGYSEPPDYIRSLAAAARALGVEIREHEKVTGFTRDGARVTGVQTAAGHFPADAVVSTVHIWTLPVLEALQVSLPVKHFVHQRYMSAPTHGKLAFPPVNADSYGGYVRPAYGNRILLGVETAERDEERITSTDFHMRTLQTDPGLRDRTVKKFTPLLPALRKVTWEYERVGLISFSMDGEPVLGPVKSVPGLFVGLAFHSGGFSYNPAAGFFLAEFVTEGKTSIDLSAFSPDRYVPSAVARHLAETVQQQHAVKRRH